MEFLLGQLIPLAKKGIKVRCVNNNQCYLTRIHPSSAHDMKMVMIQQHPQYLLVTFQKMHSFRKRHQRKLLDKDIIHFIVQWLSGEIDNDIVFELPDCL